MKRTPQDAAATFRGRSVTVMGLGLFGGGVEVARYMARNGARVTVTDARGERELSESIEALRGLDVHYALGGHRAQDFERADVVVANPAVAPSHPLLEAARRAGAQVTSEIALFLGATPARFVAVTGTQGKSSTCHFTAGLLRAAGARVHLGGNIGRSLLGALEVMRPEDVVVLELSSYQLEALPLPLSPDLAGARCAGVGVVNVLADHLERHGSIAAYEAAKRRILELARDDTWVVLPADDPRVSRWSVARGREVRFVDRDSVDGLGVSEGQFRFCGEPLGRVADLAMTGPFQRTNLLCALGLALSLDGAPKDLAAGIRELSGLEHRLQDLGTFAGHRVWDNGVSTTPDSTLSAVLALQAPLTVLIGGQAKELDWSELVAAVRERGVRILTFGASASALCEVFSKGGAAAEACGDLAGTVRRAFERLRPGETLLFSPACASFDAYRNFADRARDFRAALAGSAAAAGA